MDLRSLNIETLEQLKYTSCVIKETLRMNPPVPGGFRVALKTFELGVCEQTSLETKLSNFTIKTCISPLNPFTIHFRVIKFPKAGMSSTVSVTPMTWQRSSPTRKTSNQSVS